MEDPLNEGPLVDELLELQEARRAADACEEKFWAQFQNLGSEHCEAIVRELKGLRDAEGAAIFARRYMGWEICNNPEWLLEEVEFLRSIGSISQAARTATGKYPPKSVLDPLPT
ncbi:unnamed protein product [Symbiodinium necroappetens]|uniref:Uncharacterized protein n=1 Tax=Symbiodinium necroappetens TaxID=1628268 RepID=A0A812NX15_9DINO|nr:unnamed protein product [Symbiodinium necroappetens]